MREEEGALPVDWHKIPDDIFDNILPDYLYNVYSLNKDGDLGVKSVVYFRPVKRFDRYIVSFKAGSDIIFGV